jgi:DNA replication factor GINS
MAEELVALRFEKLVRQTRTGDPPSNEALASEEEEVALDLRGSVEKFQKVLADSVRGRKAESGEETGQDKKVLRFLKEVPAIVGADLKIYGPFVAEDVATLPAENARALVKHGAAMEVETG